MNWLKRRRIAKQAARDAIKEAVRAEEIEQMRKILSANDLTVGMVEKFLKACPSDTEVRIYPSGGGTIVIHRRDRVNVPEDFQPWDNPEAVRGPKR